MRNFIGSEHVIWRVGEWYKGKGTICDNLEW